MTPQRNAHRASGGTRTKRRPKRSRQTPARPKRARPISPEPEPLGPTDHTSSQADDGVFQPLPVHWRLLQAYEDAFQDGLAPTDGVIAKKLTVRRETICRLRRKNARLMAWIRGQLGLEAESLKSLVDRRVTQLAVSGSPEHIKLFYQFVAKVGRPFDDDPAAPPSNTGVVINLLTPRPEQYAAAFNQPTVAPAVPATSGASPPIPATIPVIPVRVPR